MALEETGSHVVLLVIHFLVERVRKARLLTTRVWRRRAEIRVSFSALLCARSGGRFLLVQNFHRPELFGPLGGVYKYRPYARRHLDPLLFRPQDVGPGDDMKNDLRGYLPRRNLLNLLKWFERREDRETETECLLRELREEFAEIGPTGLPEVPSSIPIRLVRRVTEGPERVPGHPYGQFRLFEIYEPVEDDPQAQTFLTRLFDAAGAHNRLIVVNADEIMRGRSRDSHFVGNYCAYLIGTKRHRPESPPFSDGTARRSGDIDG